MQNRLKCIINYSKTIAEQPVNVSDAVSDDKNCPDYNSDNEVGCYTADISAVNDYAPFGGLLTERTFNKGSFPNTFNGKRDDPELGDWQDYGMRIYSPWMRRLFIVDPITKDYPELTPFQFAGNGPIENLDLDGLEPFSFKNKQKGTPLSLMNKALYSTLEIESVNSVVKDERVQAGAGFVGGILFAVYGGPPGLILGPSTTGLYLSKFIAYNVPKSFDKNKVDKLPSSFTGTVLGPTVAKFGGNYAEGVVWGDFSESIFFFKRPPCENLKDVSSGIFSAYGIMTSGNNLNNYYNNTSSTNTSTSVSSSSENDTQENIETFDYSLPFFCTESKLPHER